MFDQMLGVQALETVIIRRYAFSELLYVG